MPKQQPLPLMLSGIKLRRYFYKENRFPFRQCSGVGQSGVPGGLITLIVAFKAAELSETLRSVVQIHSPLFSDNYLNELRLLFRMTLVCGIDEAGRGPVVGPMVMAGVVINKKDLSKLKRMGVRDSKLLTRKKRDELFDKIKEKVEAFEIIIIEPSEIDDALKSDNLNLNWLEAQKSAEIIKKLKPDEIIVDSPSNNCGAYSSYLEKLLEPGSWDIAHNKDRRGSHLICTHKADLKYVQVAAASILAKVVRDREIDKIKKRYGDCGPGYMSNPITQKFLEENWEKHPEIFRKSWVSYKNHEKMKFQKKIEDFEKFLQEHDTLGEKFEKEELSFLKEFGYRFIKPKSKYEIARMTGAAGAVVLYNTGKVLVQGKNTDQIKKILISKGFKAN